MARPPGRVADRGAPGTGRPDDRGAGRRRRAGGGNSWCINRVQPPAVQSPGAEHAAGLVCPAVRAPHET